MEILDEQGRIVERTANQPFHMQRTSLAQKRQDQTLRLQDYGQRAGMPAQRQTRRRKKSFLETFFNLVQACALYWCNYLPRTHTPTHFGSKVPQ